MDLYEALPASWILFVQWIREDPARAQEVGIRLIQRILTVPGLVPELEAIIAGTAAMRLESEKAALAAKPALKKPRAKREKAVFDPIEAALSGEIALREKLAELTRPQLSDMLFQYALDPSNLVSRRRTTGPIIDLIVDVSLTRSRKGDGFRS
jgi:hypothetical protein